MSRPRIGFLGVGWIGRHRMDAILRTGAVEAIAIADPSPGMVAEARALAPDARVVAGLDDILALGPDGVVIATPSALHAAQTIQALEAGVAVFCQKPLGRTAAEVRAAVEAARRADRLLGVDLSYRFTEGMRAVRERIAAGALGSIYAADLTFHNAYGPDKPWFRDPALSGGGCVMDLGVHMVDLALWAMDFPKVASVAGHLYAGGKSLAGRPIESWGRVEDYAVATITLETGATLRLACSWNLSAGQDAVIAAEFHGTSAGAALRNVGGSFYDFTAELFRGTAREALAAPPDEWGGRAAADWATRLSAGDRFDPSAASLVTVAEVLDRIYGR